MNHRGKIILFIFAVFVCGTFFLLDLPIAHAIDLCQSSSDCGAGWPPAYCQKPGSQQYGICKICSVSGPVCTNGQSMYHLTCGSQSYDSCGGGRFCDSCGSTGGGGPPPPPPPPPPDQTYSYKCESFTDINGVTHSAAVTYIGSQRTYQDDCTSQGKECRCGQGAAGAPIYCACRDKAPTGGGGGGTGGGGGGTGGGGGGGSTSTSQTCSGNFLMTYDQNFKLTNTLDCSTSGKTCRCGITGATFSCQCFAQPASGGGGTVKPGQLISHFITNCYNDDIYWFNSRYNLEDKYYSCATNTCEKGKCLDAACSSELICDGSTCVKDSADYNTFCVQQAPKIPGLPWYFWLLIIIILIIAVLVAFILIRRFSTQE